MADFLDKMKDSIEKGVNAVGVRSKEMVDAARLSSQLGTLADQKKKALEELGSRVYAEFLENGAPFAEEVRAQCEQLVGVDQQIREKEEELKEIHRQAKISLGIPLCPSCGADLTEGDKFCRACGAKVG